MKKLRCSRTKVAEKTAWDNEDLEIKSELGSPISHLIFRTMSLLLYEFQHFANKYDFCQVQNPKITLGVSEDADSVFEMKYFDKKALLAQSSQLYKQMLINAGFDKVFEIGPSFRAESIDTTRNFDSNRHLCEFTSVDFEMDLSRYNDPFYYLILFTWNMIKTVLTNLKKKYKNISSNSKKLLVNFKKTTISKKPTVITFSKAVSLLRKDGKVQSQLEALSNENEYRLGELVKKKYGTDLFIATKYPLSVRPFYTTPCPDDATSSNSFDVIYKGQEIVSGRLHQNNYQELINSITRRGINTGGLEDYLHSFKGGSCVHGGCGIGVNRMVSLFLGLDDVKRAVLFSDHLNRITF
jgi:aspartyl-tRNA synthetase